MIHQAPAVVPVDHIGAADPIGASNARDTALRRGSLDPDATMPTWVALPNELSTSDKEYDSEVVESAVTDSEAAEVDELADDSGSEHERISSNIPVSDFTRALH
jgi:hypothetical protein